jgi:hypothetical protein
VVVVAMMVMVVVVVVVVGYRRPCFPAVLPLAV